MAFNDGVFGQGFYLARVTMDFIDAAYQEELARNKGERDYVCASSFISSHEICAMYCFFGAYLFCLLVFIGGAILL